MDKNQLYVLWTNDNAITAEHMVLLYTENALLKKWWDNVTVIIWGASSTLVAENSTIQKLLKQAQKAGVEFTGCLACAAKLGTVEKLTDLGVELKYWGAGLSEIIKNKEHLITI